MAIRWSGVQWDGGNRTKCQKHGLSMNDIEHVLLRSAEIDPTRHTPFHERRSRYIAFIGKTETGRSAFLSVFYFACLLTTGEIGLRPL